ncbi:hypothetical protein [Pontivivens ytuae]|uniref:Uncharacterized protein n=1 Tax=Pontivivens ytuae TaxID=2789856 RepID=A0A7S9QCU4_9RHOB|nr:hypothetical protein [Pontivivens ytuae]QPH54293.1 hypothetical protein I0K15_00495 [Pontivivens ytuae]
MLLLNRLMGPMTALLVSIAIAVLLLLPVWLAGDLLGTPSTFDTVVLALAAVAATAIAWPVVRQLLREPDDAPADASAEHSSDDVYVPHIEK